MPEYDSSSQSHGGSPRPIASRGAYRPAAARAASSAGAHRGAHRPASSYASRTGVSGAHGAGSFGGGGGSFGPHGNGGDPHRVVKVRKKRHRGAKIALIVFAVLFVCVVGAGVALAAWVGSLDASMGIEDEQQRSDLLSVLEPVEPQAQSQAFYLLILGSDARGDEQSRSDVTMLARIDPDTATVTLVSIPRDMMVTLSGHGTQKINAAYSYGGPAGSVEAVSLFAGVSISHYAEVHFEELEQVVDTLGGIWVDVPESFDAGNGGMAFSAGEQKLSGEQALAFARERYNVSGGDFGRAQAQRIIVEAIIKQVLAASPAELPGVIGQLAESVSTDYTVGDLVSLAQRFQSTGVTVYSAACPSYSLSEDGVSYVCPMFAEWRDMMCRVDAGLDPNDVDAAIPDKQANNTRLGMATNSPAPQDYAELAANAGLTTDDVASVD